MTGRDCGRGTELSEFTPAGLLKSHGVQCVHRDVIFSVRRVLERYDLDQAAFGLPPRSDTVLRYGDRRADPRSCFSAYSRDWASPRDG